VEKGPSRVQRMRGLWEKEKYGDKIRREEVGGKGKGSREGEGRGGKGGRIREGREVGRMRIMRGVRAGRQGVGDSKGGGAGGGSGGGGRGGSGGGKGKGGARMRWGRNGCERGGVREGRRGSGVSFCMEVKKRGTGKRGKLVRRRELRSKYHPACGEHFRRRWPKGAEGRGLKGERVMG